MNKYEAMFIVRPDLSEEQRKALFGQITEALAKNNAVVLDSSVWSEKRRLTFPIKKHSEGVYYLVNFRAPGAAIGKLKYVYKLKEDILRVLFTRLEK